MINRRDFLKNSSMAAIGGLLVGSTNSCAPSTSTSKKRIGLQIYSVNTELWQREGATASEAVASGLKKLAGMGYKTLELAGYGGNGKINSVSMADFKKMADDASLEIIASHMNPPARAYTPDNKEQIMDFWKKATDEHAAIGVKYIIQPGQPSTRTIEETIYVSEIFNGAGQIAKAGGLSFGYHNHDGEFARVISETPPPPPAEGEGGGRRRGPAGEIIYDIMLKNTDPSLVFFELDVYWCVIGNQDPVAYMKKYADRIKVLHIKDKAVLGQSGMMNFEMIFKTYYENGLQDYFVELEGIPGVTQFDGAQGCADYLLERSFVK